MYVVLSNVDGCHVFECFDDAKQFCKDAAGAISKEYATSPNERYYCAKDTHTWVISTQSIKVNRKRKLFEEEEGIDCHLCGNPGATIPISGGYGGITARIHKRLDPRCQW